MKALALAMTLLALPAVAESPKGPNLDPAAVSAPGPVARLYLAQELFFQGLATKDALAVIQSARMMQRVAILEAAGQVPVASGKALKAAGPQPVPLPQAAATLQTAQTLTRGDDLLEAVLDAARTDEAVPRGAVQRATSALAPGGTDTWTLAFFGESPAELAVLGNGRSTMSITVTDENGNSPCATTASADRLYCRFTPAINGSFTVTVTNSGPTPEAYQLITN